MKKKPQDILGSINEFNVVELDDNDLSNVIGGIENGNCNGCGGGKVPGDPTNGNCSNCTC